jgi:gliding motility associated protien GldN
MKKSLLLLLLVTLVSLGQSSAQIQTVLDGAYVKEHNPTRDVIPYPHLRQADVMWSKRVWEFIDLKQKMNQSLYFPLTDTPDRQSLWGVIFKALTQDGSLTAYDLGPTLDDQFQTTLTGAQVDSMLKREVTVYVPNIETGEPEPKVSIVPMEAQDIVGYKLKEDWIFDKQRSERYVRIIGLAPVYLNKSLETGEVKGVKELFWLYFPECRYVFANHDVFNLHNDAMRMSFDDLFAKRMFSAYVVKEENVYNREIQDYAKGIDALLESEHIKNDLFLLEHDLWHY